MQVKSTQFWQLVKLQFIKAEHNYLCYGSNLFKDYWSIPKNKEIIRMLAQEYIKLHNNQITLGQTFLFYDPPNIKKKRREILLDFVNWCINYNY